MIPVKKEAKEMYENTGVYENCFFCNKPTNTWHDRTNNPVCIACAKTHKVSELNNHFNKPPMANEPTIDDKNGVIAIFDGYQFFKGDPNHKCNFCFAGDEPCTPAVDRFVKDCKVVFHYELKYHTSWDLLKPVIDEIINYILVHPEQVRPVREMSIMVNIQAAHERVYKFCKWLNQQKQTNDTER